jgi:hypothetical protein
MRQRDGIVESRLGKGHGSLDLAGEANLAEERNKTGQATKGCDCLGSFRQSQLGIAEWCAFSILLRE